MGNATGPGAYQGTTHGHGGCCKVVGRGRKRTEIEFSSYGECLAGRHVDTWDDQMQLASHQGVCVVPHHSRNSLVYHLSERLTNCK